MITTFFDRRFLYFLTSALFFVLTMAASVARRQRQQHALLMHHLNICGFHFVQRSLLLFLLLVFHLEALELMQWLILKLLQVGQLLLIRIQVLPAFCERLLPFLHLLLLLQLLLQSVLLRTHQLRRRQVLVLELMLCIA